jgi:hypothetical protein
VKWLGLTMRQISHGSRTVSGAEEGASPGGSTSWTPLVSGERCLTGVKGCPHGDGWARGRGWLAKVVGWDDGYRIGGEGEGAGDGGGAWLDRAWMRRTIQIHGWQNMLEAGYSYRLNK